MSIDLDEALKTPGGFRKYLESLPEVTEEELYCIDIYAGGNRYRHQLVWPISDEEALEQMDLTFLQVHNNRMYGKPEEMVLVSPTDPDGDRRELSRLVIDLG
jgi:hypothetical protein